jgi:hypothetical protein
MNNVLATMLWLCPVVTIPASYLVFRYLPQRALRLKAYAVMLVAVMVIDMFQVSFAQDWIDTLVRLMCLYMLAELFWLVTLLKVKKIAMVVVVAGIGVFIWGNLGWLKAGPSVIPQIWNTWTVDRYHGPKDVYVIKERRTVAASGEQARVFRLAKLIGKVPFEQTIKPFTTKKGYLNSEFSFVWHDIPEGVRVDVMVDGGVIWTLGEGF